MGKKEEGVQKERRDKRTKRKRWGEQRGKREKREGGEEQERGRGMGLWG